MPEMKDCLFLSLCVRSSEKKPPCIDGETQAFHCSLHKQNYTYSKQAYSVPI